MEFIKQFLSEASQIIHTLDMKQIERIVDHLTTIRAQAGRLFVLGVGGSAANASTPPTLPPLLQ